MGKKQIRDSGNEPIMVDYKIVQNNKTRIINTRFEEHFKLFCKNHEQDLIKAIRKSPTYMEFIKSLKPTERLEVIMPKGFSVDNIMKKKNGMLGVVLVGGNGKIVKQLELEKVFERKDIIKPLEQFALQAQIGDVLELLSELNSSIEAVRVGQLNDRFALVEAAKEQYLQAIKIKDKNLRIQGISSALLTANTAREQMYMTFKEETDAFFNSKKRASRSKQLEDIKNAFQGIHDTTYINMVIYLEMGEREAMVETTRSYKSFLENGINGPECLFERLHSKGELGRNLWLDLPTKLLSELGPSAEGKWELRDEKRLLISENRGDENVREIES